MVFEFKFPDVGEGIHEAELLKWLVKEGDQVKADQPLAEVETDKAVVELPSPKAGFILKLYAKAGETIKVGDVILAVGEKGEKAPDKPTAVAAAPKPTFAKPAMMQGVQPATTGAKVPAMPGIKPFTAQPQQFVPLQQAQPGEILATPAIRQLARQMNVDISKVKGSGAGGRITEDDVRAFASAGEGRATGISAAGAAPMPALKQIPMAVHGPVDRQPYHSLRKKIGEHMKLSFYTAPFAVHMDEVDVEDLVKLRGKEKANAEKLGIKLTYLPFIVKAVVNALKAYPIVNASLDEAKGEIIYKKYYNIGIALDTEDGLMVPVVKDADKKSVYDIAKDISRLAELGRARKVALEDLKGGTFTITNIGSIGGIYAVPIINYPEAAILGVMKIVQKPVFMDNMFVARNILTLVLSFDHRLVDGAVAARFVNEIKKYLESPNELMG